VLLEVAQGKDAALSGFRWQGNPPNCQTTDAAVTPSPRTTDAAQMQLNMRRPLPNCLGQNRTLRGMRAA